MAKVGLDVDGVLADFNPSYIELLNMVSGRGEDPSYVPTEWSYEHLLGFTKADVAKAWDLIKSSDFWLSLKPLHAMDLGGFEASNDLYFITTRPGQRAKVQTEAWLQVHLGVRCPTVIISGNKGPVAKGLGLDIFVDDRPENLWSVKGSSPTTACYVINYPYNASVDPQVATRIDDLGDLINGDHLVQFGC